MKFEETLFDLGLGDKKHLNGQLRLFKARGGATVVAQVVMPWSSWVQVFTYFLNHEIVLKTDLSMRCISIWWESFISKLRCPAVLPRAKQAKNNTTGEVLTILLDPAHTCSLNCGHSKKEDWLRGVFLRPTTPTVSFQILSPDIKMFRQVIGVQVSATELILVNFYQPLLCYTVNRTSAGEREREEECHNSLYSWWNKIISRRHEIDRGVIKRQLWPPQIWRELGR